MSHSDRYTPPRRAEWLEHPSDFHADEAIGALNRARAEPDSRKREEDYQVAQVTAALSLRDAVLELRAVIKDDVNRYVDATADLTRAMHKVIDFQQARARRGAA